MNYPYICPYCNHHSTVSDTNRIKHTANFSIPSGAEFRTKIMDIFYIVCPNTDCNEYSISAELHNADRADLINVRLSYAEKINTWNLVPQSNAKPFPSYIPKAIIDDYEESCSIKNLSPKASATLSRRCLQGMIRDFWGVNKDSLYKEIGAIEDKVDAVTWQALNAVRSIGNIGAHMEKDINLIIEVDPPEAQLLIDLIETLLTEWYVNRYERQQKMQAIIDLSRQKAELKQ